MEKLATEIPRLLLIMMTTSSMLIVLRSSTAPATPSPTPCCLSPTRWSGRSGCPNWCPSPSTRWWWGWWWPTWRTWPGLPATPSSLPPQFLYSNNYSSRNWFLEIPEMLSLSSLSSSFGWWSSFYFYTDGVGTIIFHIHFTSVLSVSCSVFVCLKWNEIKSFYFSDAFQTF